MAKEAERLLTGAGWLPEPLRHAEIEMATDAQSGDAEALPDFLGEDEDEASAENEDDQSRMAEAE